MHKGGNWTVACGTSNMGVGKLENPPGSISLIAAYLQAISEEDMPSSAGVYWGQVTLTLARRPPLVREAIAMFLSKKASA